jgi:hypothetical protein
MVSDNRVFIIWLVEQLVGRLQGWEELGGGEGGQVGWVAGQQLSNLHFISQIIKDDYRLPF